MATKNNNGRKNENNGMSSKDVAEKWLDVPLATWVMEIGAYAIPLASVAELVDLVDLLADRPLVGATVYEREAKERMLGAAAVCARAIEHNASLALARIPAEENQKRLRLARQVASMALMVDARARSTEPTIAEEGKRVETEVLGGKVDAMRMGARALRVWIRAMKDRLDDQPGLREKLEVCVPKMQIDRLFAESERWGKEGESEAAKALPLDLRVLRAHLRQRTSEYVMNVLATVRGDDPATSARASKALAPVVELREELRVRQARRARGADTTDAVVETDDEVLDLALDDDEPSAPEPATAPVSDDDG